MGKHYFGIAISSGDRPFCLAEIDTDLHMIKLQHLNLNELLATIGSQEMTLMGINAPAGLNLGKLEQNPTLPGLFMGPGRPRKFDMRQAELDLIREGLPARETPSSLKNCPRWMKQGFKLYKGIRDLNLKPYNPQINNPDDTGLFLEVKAESAFQSLNGYPLYLARSLEGRIQRQLILYNDDFSITDPMVFFEEVTPYRLLSRSLPVECIHSEVELNSLMAAYTAMLMINEDTRVRQFGDADEGFVYIPVQKPSPGE